MDWHRSLDQGLWTPQFRNMLNKEMLYWQKRSVYPSEYVGCFVDTQNCAYIMSCFVWAMVAQR